MGAKKKIKEVKEVIPFQIQNEKIETKWFIQSGWKVYKKLTPLPFKWIKPDLRQFKN